MWQFDTIGFVQRHHLADDPIDDFVPDRCQSIDRLVFAIGKQLPDRRAGNPTFL